MTFDQTPLQRVTLTFLPHGGYPQERTFDHITPDDLVFVVAALHARKRRALTGRGEVQEMLATASRSQLEWHEEQLRTALDEGMGAWRHFVPRWIRLRILERLVEQYYVSTAAWGAEMGDLYERVDALQRTVTRGRVSKRVAEPMVLCAGPECSSSIPLRDLGNPPEGWAKDASGNPRCADHPVTSASSAVLVKVAS
ncbi:hypothetical protein E6R60_26795 [Streptomyces sp. A0642]|uniref:hypothetical protein n=1 Tax=Streptomyces sp. A0642 TaxID=2563100 RepID=UPI0010A1FFDB|nr:hypothetical protein [Streptomyces sp. A0642]THA72539.1 hypothetical protein E6R60_26795 [Streptomyces sp. A0642]